MRALIVEGSLGAAAEAGEALTHAGAVEEVERAGHTALAAHAAAARAVLRNVLDHEGLDAARVDATVTRDGDHLVVTLLPGETLPNRVAETAAVRALAAVRAIDRQASIIDVTLA